MIHPLVMPALLCCVIRSLLDLPPLEPLPAHPLFATVTITVVDLDVKGKSDLPRGTGAASHPLQNEVPSVPGVRRAPPQVWSPIDS